MNDASCVYTYVCIYIHACESSCVCLQSLQLVSRSCDMVCDTSCVYVHMYIHTCECMYTRIRICVRRRVVTTASASFALMRNGRRRILCANTYIYTYMRAYTYACLDMYVCDRMHVVTHASAGSILIRSDM